MIIRYTTLMIIIFVCVIGIASTQTNDIDRVWNVTEIALDKTYQNVSTIYSLAINDTSKGFEPIIKNIVFKIADVFTYTLFSITKISARFAIENPQINYRMIIYLIIFILVLMVIVPLTKLIVIIWILCLDGYRHFKEKKEIRRLKDETNKIHNN